MADNRVTLANVAGELLELGPVVGIGMSGTAEAVEMVCDEQLMQQVRRRIGAGFKDPDFEVVIGTDLVNGRQLAEHPRSRGPIEADVEAVAGTIITLKIDVGRKRLL